MAETFRRKRQSCFWKSLPPWHGGDTWKEWESSFAVAAPNPCQIPWMPHRNSLFPFWILAGMELLLS